MAPPLIALDLGGVLIDVAPLQLAQVGAPDLDHAFFGHTHDGRPEQEQVALGALAVGEWLATVADRLGRPPEEIETAWRSRLTLADEAHELIEALADVDVVLWSNTDAAHFAHLAAWLPTAWAAERRRALSFEIGALKPAAAFFERALDRLDGAPTLFVDDKPANVAAARAARVRAELAKGPVAALRHVRRALADGV